MSRMILIDDARYAGQYVAMPSFNDRQIVAHGPKPKEVIAEAKTKGYSRPVVYFVPDKKCGHIYRYALQFGMI